jgi:hypothetical protein
VTHRTDLSSAPADLDDLEAEVDALVAEEKARDDTELRTAKRAEALSRRAVDSQRTRSPEDWQAELGPLGYTVALAVWPDCPLRPFASRPEIEARWAPVVVKAPPWRLTAKGIVFDANGPVQYGRRQTTPAEYRVCSPVFQLTRGCLDDRKFFHGDGRVTGGTHNRPSTFAVLAGSKWKTVTVAPGVSPTTDSHILLRTLTGAGLWLNPEALVLTEFGPSGPNRPQHFAGSELLLRFLLEHETQLPATQ